MGGRSLRVLTDVSSLENLCIPSSSKAFLEALTLDVSGSSSSPAE